MCEKLNNGKNIFVSSKINRNFADRFHRRNHEALCLGLRMEMSETSIKLQGRQVLTVAHSAWAVPAFLCKVNFPTTSIRLVVYSATLLFFMVLFVLWALEGNLKVAPDTYQGIKNDMVMGNNCSWYNWCYYWIS